MKHLKKYNESKNSDIIEYIKVIFAEFIDDGSEVVYFEWGNHGFNNI